MTSRTAAVLIAAAVAAPVFMAAPAHAAPPEGACRDPEPAHPVVTEEPWAQKMLDLRGTWKHSTGAGVVVGVVDSGVDADHPQLRGKVLPGRDFFLVGQLPGNFDCVSHGTAVASIIVASPAKGTGFRGVAPNARVLPVRITDRDLNDSGEPTPIDPNAIARGIRYATDQGAKVINLSLSGYRDYPAVRGAVAYARSKDVLLVAAAGNRQTDGTTTIASFPAAYDGVLGVGSIDVAGQRSGDSQIGPFVDLVAPGDAVLAATRAGGHNYWKGTSFAAPFVSGVAALVRSAWPELTAAQVARRLVATAAPASGGAASPEYGAGILDPYRAVVEGLSDVDPAGLPAVVTPPRDLAQERNIAWWQDMGTGAKLVAGGVVVAIGLAALLAVVLPRGGRRRWAPARAAALPAAPPRDEPPEEVFLFPPPPMERTSG
ncbi:type VII secretion-associated serine protease mycosin [Actinophytocola sp. NPDC049390]|uniref:type VII secretion-associated serine protease mycosin n=1 Tax=Actinophytocola sp. NPDC049390 TaxID=3363894 RepID=UPI0037B4E416